MSFNFSNSMDTDLTNVFNTIEGDPYAYEEELIPDPEGYYVGQEETNYLDDDYVRDYDDMYESDFDYGFND